LRANGASRDGACGFFRGAGRKRVVVVSSGEGFAAPVVDL
jgi:hypothetical protein